MTKAEMILNKLKEVNTAMSELKTLSESVNKSIPPNMSSDIITEINNLRESVYLIDRDVTAWLKNVIIRFTKMEEF